MKIIKAELVAIGVKHGQFPEDDIPEIAFVGRSNVGKSSLLNSLMVRKNLARTSGSPGKTQTVNFYLVNDYLRLVDLPGYGYAKVSMATRQKWGEMIENFLLTRKNLKGVIQLIDVRHKPTEDDILLDSWLFQKNIPGIVVATKADKISKGNWQKHKKIILEHLESSGKKEFILYSSETGIGREELWEKMNQLISARH